MSDRTQDEVVTLDALRAAREERRATEIYYRGFAYNVCSQFGIDSLKAAIRRDGND